MSSVTAHAPEVSQATERRRVCLAVGYDGSEGARHAAARAASVLADDGKLVLVDACRPLHSPTSPLASASERRELGQATVDALLERSTVAVTAVPTRADDA